jgi:hypothetical protein
MNEAPVAISDAPVDRNVLLLKVLIAGMTPPFRGLRFASIFLAQRNPTKGYQILKTVVGIERCTEVSAPRGEGSGREMSTTGVGS